MRESIKPFRSGFFQEGSGKLFNALLAAEMTGVVREEVRGWLERLYAPVVVLRLFVEQVLHADHACQDVVVKICERACGAG